MRTIISVLYIVFYLIIAWPVSLYAYHLQKTDSTKFDSFVSDIVQKWARRMLWVAGASVSVEGLENIPNETTVFVCNHQSDFDIPLVLGNLDKSYGIIAKKELEKVPLISRWMRLFGCTFIDRQNPREAVKALNEAGDRLKLGKSIIIFPEGTRSKSSEIGDFKSGAFKMAFKHNTPVTPIALDNTYKLFEANGRRVRPAKVRMKIFPPIETKDMDRQQQKTLGDDIKASINDWINVQ